MLGLAKACYGLEDYQRSIDLLDALKTHNPDFRSPEGHLLYACAQEHAGNIASAIHEYETPTKYFSGPEPACRLDMLLKAQGNAQPAGELFAGIV